MERLDGWSVEYLHGTDAEGTGNVKSMDFGQNSAVQMVDQSSALYCGSQWQELSHREYYRLRLFLDKSYSLIANMGNYLQLDSAHTGLNGFAEIIGVDDSDARWTAITVQLDKGNS
jgi:hypothetical protein